MVLLFYGFHCIPTEFSVETSIALIFICDQYLQYLCDSLHFSPLFVRYRYLSPSITLRATKLGSHRGQRLTCLTLNSSIPNIIFKIIQFGFYSTASEMIELLKLFEQCKHQLINNRQRIQAKYCIGFALRKQY